MKILFLGYLDSDPLRFLKEWGEEVVARGPTEKITREWTAAQHFDFLISYGYRHILRREILELFPRRALNLHIAYLPWNRGADPNFWSFLEATPKGVSLHYLEEGIDTGDLIAQKCVDFSEGGTLKTSYETLRRTVEQLFYEYWPSIRDGQCRSHPQPAGGSFHAAKDKIPFEKILTQGWDTPILVLEKYGRNR